MSRDLLGAETQRFKKLILESLKSHLDQGDFERSPPNLGLICALAELLQFFAIGSPERAIDPREREWWLNFVDSLARGYRKTPER